MQTFGRPLDVVMPRCSSSLPVFDELSGTTNATRVPNMLAMRVTQDVR
jgi:hypothetical protein